MTQDYDPDRWPDGLSLSLPFPFGRIGGTYYWNPGSPTAPQLTVNRNLGLPGAGLETVFLAPGMTSSDTLGYGINGNVSTLIPSVTLNGTFPSDGDSIFPHAMPRVTSVGAGIGTFNASPALTATYTPSQVADALKKYLFPPTSGPAAGNVLVRDSASAAGVPSRNNVFEYGFPDSSPSPQAPSSPPRGLPGMIQDYIRNNAY